MRDGLSVVRRRRLLATAAVVTVPSTLAGCSDGPDEDVVEPPARVVESDLIREEVGTEEESVAVEGVVERTRDEEIGYLEVRVEFYDEDDELLDSTVEQVPGVEEGNRWPFRVTFPHVGERAADVVDHDVEVVRNP